MHSWTGHCAFLVTLLASLFSKGQDAASPRDPLRDWIAKETAEVVLDVVYALDMDMDHRSYSDDRPVAGPPAETVGAADVRSLMPSLLQATICPSVKQHRDLRVLDMRLFWVRDQKGPEGKKGRLAGALLCGGIIAFVIPDPHTIDRTVYYKDRGQFEGRLLDLLVDKAVPDDGVRASVVAKRQRLLCEHLAWTELGDYWEMDTKTISELAAYATAKVDAFVAFAARESGTYAGKTGGRASERLRAMWRVFSKEWTPDHPKPQVRREE